LKPVRQRKLVDEMRGDWNVSIRRACHVFLLDRSTYHYKSRRPGQAALEQRIKDICQTRVRYGYRRVHVLLRREGWHINQKRTRRIYRELGLQLRNKTPKRRVKAKLREDRRNATRPNDLGHGLRARSAGNRDEAARSDDRRHLLALLASVGAALLLPRR
jgi:putative transposase